MTDASKPIKIILIQNITSQRFDKLCTQTAQNVAYTYTAKTVAINSSKNIMSIQLGMSLICLPLVLWSSHIKVRLGLSQGLSHLWHKWLHSSALSSPMSWHIDQSIHVLHKHQKENEAAKIKLQKFHAPLSNQSKPQQWWFKSLTGRRHKKSARGHLYKISTIKLSTFTVTSAFSYSVSHNG